MYWNKPGWTPGGGVATLRASPNAPGKLLLSRTINVPGGLSLNIFIAGIKILKGRIFFATEKGEKIRILINLFISII